MTTSREILLSEVEAFLARSGMPPTAFGELLMNDRHLVRRLRSGRDVTLSTADRIRQFILAREGGSGTAGSSRKSEHAGRAA